MKKLVLKSVQVLPLAVDFTFVAGATFAEVFEQALGGRPVGDAGPEVTPLQSVIEHRSSVIDHRSFTGAVPLWVAGRYTLTAASRPVRTLGPAERHALDELNGLGAKLRDDFTAAELRSAFRALARRHHPDRYEGQSPTDQAHAARIFAFIAGHYRCLAALRDR